MVDLSLEALSEFDQVVRTSFSSENEAFKFYNSYALKKGFSVRRCYVERDKHSNEICKRKFVCSQQGLREMKHMEKQNRKRKARNITCCGCSAKLVVKPFDPEQYPSFASRIAKNCATRYMILVPFNAHNSHWTLLVLNYRRTEIQILNSLTSAPSYRDENLETTLVASLQSCVEYGRDYCQISPCESNLTRWKKKMYDAIPQRTNSNSCGVFVIKYMLLWNGVEISENFTQEQVDIFRRKICCRLLHSECNRLRRESYKQPITKEQYDALNPKANVADEDVEIIGEGKNTKEDDVGNTSTKKKRGRPERKKKKKILRRRHQKKTQEVHK